MPPFNQKHAAIFVNITCHLVKNQDEQRAVGRSLQPTEAAAQRPKSTIGQPSPQAAALLRAPSAVAVLFNQASEVLASIESLVAASPWHSELTTQSLLRKREFREGNRGQTEVSQDL